MSDGVYNTPLMAIPGNNGGGFSEGDAPEEEVLKLKSQRVGKHVENQSQMASPRLKKKTGKEKRMELNWNFILRRFPLASLFLSH